MTMNKADAREFVILCDFADISGGAAAVALQSARALAARGHEVTVFSAVGPVSPALVDVPRLRVVCLGQEEIVKDPNRLRAMTRGMWNRPAAAALREVLRDKDPRRTIVHAHLWMKALSPSVFPVVTRGGFPLVVTLHDFFIACPNGGFYEYPRQVICKRKPLSVSCLKCQCDRRSYAQKLWRVWRLILQRYDAGLPERASHFVGVSGFSLDILRPYLPARVPATVVRNPVDCADLGPAPVAENDVFVFAGRLVPEKGPRLFAQAARAAGVRAVFVGDGELRAELARDFPEATITGWQTPAEVNGWLRRARALVFASTWYETLGLVVIEAAANGVPTVVADGCAASEFVADGERGRHFQHGSADALAARLAELRDDPAGAARMGRAAYDWYWRRPWNAEAHVEELLAVYDQVLPRTEDAPVALTA